MKFTEKLNKIEGKVYTIEEEIVVSNGKYEGFLGHDNININTLAIYTEKGLNGDKVVNYTISKVENLEWKTFIELYHPTNVFATYETSGDIVEAEDINILQDSILDLYEKLKYLSTDTDITKELQELKSKDIELEQAIDELIGSSPIYLDTLKELADAIDNDPKFATNIKNELLSKATIDYVDTELKKKSDVHTHPYKLDSYVPNWNEIANKPAIPTVDVTKSYVDEKLALKSDVHTHPYKSDTYVPSWSEVTGKPTNATQSNNGFMSSLDKIKLDGIQNNANYFSGDYNDLTNKPNAHLKGEILQLEAGTTEISSMNIPTGVAPSSPVDGDMWKTSSTIQVRFNTTTRNLYHNGNLAVMSVAEGQTGTATTARTINASRLKDIILHHSPKKLSELENDVGLGGLPSQFTWSDLRGY